MEELELRNFYDLRYYTKEQAEEEFKQSKMYIEGTEYFISLDTSLNTKWWNIYQIKR